MSDSTNARLLCDYSKEGICIKCSDNDCNNQPKIGSSELSCLKCNDSKICAYGQNESYAVPCEKEVKFGEEESCYTLSPHCNYILPIIHD